MAFLALAGCQTTTVEYKRGETTQVSRPIAGPTTDWTVEFAEPSRNVVVERFRFQNGITAQRQVLRGVADRQMWIVGGPQQLIAPVLETEFFKNLGFSMASGTVQPYRDGALYFETRGSLSCAVYAARVGGQDDGDLLRVLGCGPGTTAAIRARIEAVADRFYGVYRAPGSA
jgi:hypothetical protein